MVYVRSFDEQGKDEKEVDEGSSLTTNTGGVIGTGQQGDPKAAKRESGAFTNLRQYVEVNALQAKQFTADTTNALRSGIEQGKDTVRREYDGFKGQVDQNTIRDDEQLRGRNASEIVGDDTARDAYQKRLNASYTGPTAFTSEKGYQDLADKQQTIGNTSTFAGKKQVAQDLYTKQRPTYTQGEANLDGVFLNQPKDSRQQFQALRDWTEGEVGGFKSGIADQSGALVQAAQDTTQQTRDTYRQDLAGDRSALNSSVDQAVLAENQRRKAAYDQAVNSGEKYDSGGWNKLTNELNQADYIRYGGDVNSSHVLTDQQLAEARALAALGGDPTSNPYTGRQEASEAFSIDQAYQDQVASLQTEAKQNENAFNETVYNAERDAYEKMVGYVDTGDSQSTLSRNWIVARMREIPLGPNPLNRENLGQHFDDLGITTPHEMQEYLVGKYASTGSGNGFGGLATFDE